MTPAPPSLAAPPEAARPSEATSREELVGRLRRRVQQLEDQEALRAVMIRGWLALDLKQWDAHADSWSVDAVLEFGPWGTLHGRTAIRDRLRDTEVNYRHLMHHILNMDFAVVGDTARGVGFMWFVGIADDDGGDHYNMGGPYEFEFGREADRWRLTCVRASRWWKRGADTINAFNGLADARTGEGR